MALTNRERVGRAMDLLADGLKPFVERELRRVYGKTWHLQAEHAVNRSLTPSDDGKSAEGWDAHTLLQAMWNRWNDVFSEKLGHGERSIVSELRATRNRWAHNEHFSTRDAARALDNTERLLKAVSAPDAEEAARQYQEILRIRYEEETRQETRRSARAATQGTPETSLKPWRDIVTPHADVASGRYQQAEFAADLGQVHRGEATSEYQSPRDFYSRTYLTEGIKELLVIALQRLGATGGDPVIKLQTNFGGGKTHAMLALYHMVSGVTPDDLPGIDTVMQVARVNELPLAQRAVLVGTDLPAAQSHRKPDGTEIHTLWGELAYQLLGQDGYERIAESDRRGVSPGSAALREIFAAASPCLILIDEWVAFVRHLYNTTDMPAGSFDTNLSFAQSLTEAAHATPGTLLVATLPQSQIEIGGHAGAEALTRLENTFGRMEAVWRPASTEESFEIVRRRLFEPIADPSLYPARDAVVKRFGELYRSQSQEFPADCKEGAYERRLKQAYPVHPELFDRLYEDWSSLERFQRTRGVLRLMAKAIHALWEAGDKNLLIMPAQVPIHDSSVRDELTRYLEEHWLPVIEKDVDGPAALPLEIDGENPTLGRYSASRRVARTIYLGSAPLAGAASRGLDERHIKLGCVQPGESVATFGDALRRLTDRATFLYVDGRRYWYSTQPNVTRVAQDRAAALRDDQVVEEIERRLRLEARHAGDFSRVHVAPRASGDIPDERDARLVIVGPEFAHSSGDEESRALRFASEILDSRGNSPRRYKNTLAFMAADAVRLAELERAVRLYLAWSSIDEEHQQLNLNFQQHNQAKSKRQEQDSTVQHRIPEAYQWLFVHDQPNDEHGRPGAVICDMIRLTGGDRLAIKASRRLKNDEQLFVELGPARLRIELDRVPLWRGDHVDVRQLCEDFAQYLYLPRLKSDELLFGAIREGAARAMWQQDTFAYAEGYDDAASRYLGLVAGDAEPTVSLSGLVVKPEVALNQKQLDEEARRRAQQSAGVDAGVSSGGTGTDGGATGRETETSGPQTTTTTQEPQIRRFYGSVEVDSVRVNRDVSQIAQEVIQHLEALPNSDVRVTVEIEADLPAGAPDQTVRIVSENARVLKFRQFGFEEE